MVLYLVANIRGASGSSTARISTGRVVSSMKTDIAHQTNMGAIALSEIGNGLCLRTILSAESWRNKKNQP
jgi:hypothetical protein